MTVALVALKVLGIVVLFDPIGVHAFDLPKSLWSRSIEWLLVGALALTLLTYGLGVIPRTRIHLAALAIVVSVCLSAIVAEDRYVALYGDRERYLGVTFVVDMAITYLAIAIAFRTPRDWVLLLGGVIAGGIVSVGYAVLQALGLDPLSWRAGSRDRPFGTLGQPDIFAHFLAIFFALTTALAVFLEGERRLRLRVGLAVLAVVTVLVAAVVATRGSVLGFGAAAVTIAVIYVWRGRAARRVPRVIAVAPLVAAIVLIGVVAFTPLGARLRASLSGVAIQDRVLIYDSAAHAFEDRWLLGFGPDNFAAAYPRYRQPGSSNVIGLRLTQTSAHSWIFQTAATTGVVGLVTLVAALVATAVVLWRRGLRLMTPLYAALLSALAAYWCEGLVTVGSISVDWVPWVVLGAAAGVARVVDPAEPARRRLPSAAAALVAGVCVFGSVTGIVALRASRDAWRAEASAQSTVAIGAARSAVGLDGGRADYWNRLGLTLDAAGRWTESAAAYMEAAHRAPYESTYWSNAARSFTRQAAVGDPNGRLRDDALSAARRGVLTDPNDPAPHQALAEIAANFNEYDLALEEAMTAFNLFTNDALDDQIADQVANYVTDLPRARNLLENAIAIRDSSTLRVALARVLSRLGDLSGAQASARRAVALDPRNVEAQQVLTELGTTP